MNRNQTIMCAAGAAAGAAVLVAGWMSFSIWSEDDMLASDVAGAMSSARVLNSAPIAPTREAMSAIDANTAAVEEWTADAAALVARGDIAVDGGISPERFKQAMLREARAMASLPGSADGKLVKPDFGFGYPDFIVGGAMPERARLAEMQRRWEDVKFLVGAVAGAGATELLEIEVAVQDKPPEPAAAKGNGRQRPRPARKPAAEKEKGPASHRYNVKFSARPAALVKVFNTLASSDRFVSVDSFSFAKETDTLMEKLEGGERKGRDGMKNRARPLPGGDKSAKDSGEAKKGLVTDPSLDIPFTVSMAVTVFDFGTAGKGAAK